MDKQIKLTIKVDDGDERKYCSPKCPYLATSPSGLDAQPMCKIFGMLSDPEGKPERSIRCVLAER